MYERNWTKRKFSSIVNLSHDRAELRLYAVSRREWRAWCPSRRPPTAVIYPRVGQLLPLLSELLPLVVDERLIRPRPRGDLGDGDAAEQQVAGLLRERVLRHRAGRGVLVQQLVERAHAVLFVDLLGRPQDRAVGDAQLGRDLPEGLAGEEEGFDLGRRRDGARLGRGVEGTFRWRHEGTKRG